MSLINAFKVSSTGLQAQSARLNAIASNMANADTVSSTEQDAYRARKVVFEAIKPAGTAPGSGQGLSAQVRIKELTEDATAPRRVYEPGNPIANQDGFVFASNVNAAEEMVDLISASRSYQTNADVMNTMKTLMLKTLQIGQ
jgi:flagellar basal-body rod protein FlgC